MNSDIHLAYFNTWTVYGTWLQGDVRGWRQSDHGHQLPQPLLADWRRERLSHTIRLLDNADRKTVNAECQRLAEYRGWHLWTANARSNHVHVVVTAVDMRGGKVRDQLKANCTRVLRDIKSHFRDRPVWTKGGDWQCINSGDSLQAVVKYVTEAQDQMNILKRPTSRDSC
jgi:REP element-mobilizing transposase RayT